MAGEAREDSSGRNANVQLVVRFNDALNAHDVDAMMRLMAEDCVFVNTSPAPDGSRYEGQPAVRAFWEGFFRSAREQRITIQEIFAADDRCVMLWTYHWLGSGGEPRHVQGADVYRLRGGLIAEKLSYVKG